MKSKTLIIAGMHRSGTSLISQWINKCGLFLGENLNGESIGNVEGHFEDLEFLRIHEEILNANNLPTDGLTEEKVNEVNIYQKEKIKTIIKIKDNLYPEWGWKEPRTCLFLDLYRELLPEAFYLIVVRDFQSVVGSLLKREFLSVEKKYLSRKYLSRLIWTYFRRSRRLKKFYQKNVELYLKVWIAYNEAILKNITELKSENYLVVDYFMLQKQDLQVFSYLKDQWHFNLNFHPFKDIYKESLMSRKIDFYKYIQDKNLINKAFKIEEKLNAYLDGKKFKQKSSIYQHV